MLRYSVVGPSAALAADHLLDLALYAGEGVGAIRDIPPAGDLVRRLWNECMAAG